MNATPQAPTATRASAAGTWRGRGAPSRAANVGSHSEIRTGSSSTTLSAPLASVSSAARTALAASWAWVKENVEVPRPTSGSLPALACWTNEPSAA
jgi:hypothetical protein